MVNISGCHDVAFRWGPTRQHPPSAPGGVWDPHGARRLLATEFQAPFVEQMSAGVIVTAPLVIMVLLFQRRTSERPNTDVTRLRHARAIEWREQDPRD